MQCQSTSFELFRSAIRRGRAAHSGLIRASWGKMSAAGTGSKGHTSDSPSKPKAGCSAEHWNNEADLISSLKSETRFSSANQSRYFPLVGTLEGPLESLTFE